MTLLAVAAIVLGTIALVCLATLAWALSLDEDEEHGRRGR